MAGSILHTPSPAGKATIPCAFASVVADVRCGAFFSLREKVQGRNSSTALLTAKTNAAPDREEIGSATDYELAAAGEPPDTPCAVIWLWAVSKVHEVLTPTALMTRMANTAINANTRPYSTKDCARLLAFFMFISTLLVIHVGFLSAGLVYEFEPLCNSSNKTPRSSDPVSSALPLQPQHMPEKHDGFELGKDSRIILSSAILSQFPCQTHPRQCLIRPCRFLLNRCNYSNSQPRPSHPLSPQCLSSAQRDGKQPVR